MEEDLEEKLAGGAELLEALNSDCETLKGLNEALTEANNKQSLQLKHLGTELASFK